MKHKVLFLLMAACAVSAHRPNAASAKPPPRPQAAPPSASPGHHRIAHRIKLPPGVPVVKGILKTAFSLRYQDIKIGTGAEAEPNKMYNVHYTGWLAEDGRKFDSSYDHRPP